MQESRLFRIVYYLWKTGKQIAPELAQKSLEVSIRTIYRDIDAISSAGIPYLCCTKGKGGGIFYSQRLYIGEIISFSRARTNTNGAARNNGNCRQNF